jgi:hypothetical protein
MCLRACKRKKSEENARTGLLLWEGGNSRRSPTLLERCSHVFDTLYDFLGTLYDFFVTSRAACYEPQPDPARSCDRNPAKTCRDGLMAADGGTSSANTSFVSTYMPVAV